MLPLRDANPTSRTAVVTLLFIAANVIVFLFLEPITAPNREQAEFFACNAAIPYEVTHGKTLADALDDGEIRTFEGEAYASLQRDACPDKNVWLSILYSMFLHGGILHIAGNMLFLWVFGNNIEDRLGIPKYILFYLLAGVAATYAQAFVSPSSATPLVGASGAIAGVLGAYLLMFPQARVMTLIIFFFISVVEMRAVVVIGAWFVLQLFQSVGSIRGGPGGGVAYMAHVGGFVAGMLLLLLLRPRREPRATVY